MQHSDKRRGGQGKGLKAKGLAEWLRVTRPQPRPITKGYLDKPLQLGGNHPRLQTVERHLLGGVLLYSAS